MCFANNCGLKPNRKDSKQTNNRCVFVMCLGLEEIIEAAYSEAWSRDRESAGAEGGAGMATRTLTFHVLSQPWRSKILRNSKPFHQNLSKCCNRFEKPRCWHNEIQFKCFVEEVLWRALWLARAEPVRRADVPRGARQRGRPESGWIKFHQSLRFVRADLGVHRQTEQRSEAVQAGDWG